MASGLYPSTLTSSPICLPFWGAESPLGQPLVLMSFTKAVDSSHTWRAVNAKYSFHTHCRLAQGTSPGPWPTGPYATRGGLPPLSVHEQSTRWSLRRHRVMGPPAPSI